MAVWLFVLLVLFLTTLITFAVVAHAGFFSSVIIRTSIPASLPRRVAYVVCKGPYTQVGKTLSALGGLAPSQTLFSVFYDDPKKVS